MVDEVVSGDWGTDVESKNNVSKVLCIRGTDISDISCGYNGNPPTRYITKKNEAEKCLKCGDIIIEISGGSPTQSTGRAAFIDENYLQQLDCNAICSNFCRILRCKNIAAAHLVFSALVYLYNNNTMFSYENGTTGIKNLDLSSLLENEKVAQICKNTQSDFSKLSKEIVSKISFLRHENTKLNNLKSAYIKKFFD